MTATISGRYGCDVIARSEYETRASRRMPKSSSGVHEVELTRSLLFPSSILSAKSVISDNFCMEAPRCSEAMAWKVEVGRS